MEENERDPAKFDQLNQFADRIANSLLKETITETNSVKIWSIPCSADCHNHTQNKGGFI